MKKQPKRWRLIPIIFGVNIFLIALFGYLDVLQIKTFFDINTEKAWELYTLHTMPTLWKMWLVTFLTIGIIWYIVHKDWSESIGLSLSGMIMVSTGLEDLFYFIWSPQTLQPCMPYINNLNFMNIASRILGEGCVSSTALIINAIFGIVLAIIILILLVRFEPYKN